MNQMQKFQLEKHTEKDWKKQESRILMLLVLTEILKTQPLQLHLKMHSQKVLLNALLHNKT